MLICKPTTAINAIRALAKNDQFIKLVGNLGNKNNKLICNWIAFTKR